jgi:hypothetical protein
MPAVLDANAITHGIQLAVAPVFLLTAVTGMIAAVAGRLARIIDRARIVEDQARASTDPELLARSYAELATLRTRGRMTNVCIGLLGEIMGLQAVRLAVVGFLAGVLSFLLALVLFLSETVMATRLLDFHLLRQPPR